MEGREMTAATYGPVRILAPIDRDLREAFERHLETSLGVSAASFNGMLQKHGAVVAGSFCIPPIAASMGSSVLVTPGDVDIWVSREAAKAFLEHLRLLFPNMPRRITQNRFELSEYNRLREDVAAIYHIAGTVSRMNIQVMACTNLPRALASFDINVSAVGWTGGDSIQVWAPHAISGIKKGVMQLTRTAMKRQSAVELRRTLLRLRKYMAFGFALKSVDPLVAALHDHFGVDCGRGEVLCESFASYFTDRSKPWAGNDALELKSQAERARLVRYLMRLVALPRETQPHAALHRQQGAQVEDANERRRFVRPPP